jgi:hypothetical protein
MSLNKLAFVAGKAGKGIGAGDRSDGGAVPHRDQGVNEG